VIAVPSCPARPVMWRCWNCDRLPWCLAVCLMEEDLAKKAGSEPAPRPHTPQIVARKVNGKTIYVVQ